jgi:hypothetical protein
VYCTVICPLISVVPLVGLRDAPLVLVDSVNVTVVPGTRLPLASFTVVVSVEVPLAFTVLGEALSCTLAAGPGTKEMSMCVRNPRASTVTTAVPAVVLAVRSTCATPFVSVVTVTLPPLSAFVVVVELLRERALLVLRTTGDPESAPAVVAKVADTPAMAAPDPLVSWRRSGMALWPSAMTAVDPFVVDRASWTAFALFAGASAFPDPELLQPVWRVSMLKHRTRKIILTTWVCTGMRLPFSLTQIVASVEPRP